MTQNGSPGTNSEVMVRILAEDLLIKSEVLHDFAFIQKQANKHIHFALNYTLIIALQHFYCFRHSAPSVRGLLTFWINASLFCYFSLTWSADILGLQMWRILETTDHHSGNCSKCGNHFHSKSNFCELLAPCSAEKETTL
jgi:hypothetical protein